MKSAPKCLLLAVGLVSLQACSTTQQRRVVEMEDLEGFNLPFHLVILPVEEGVYETRYSSDKSGETIDEESEGVARVDLLGKERVDLAKDLEDVLGTNVFSRVSRLNAGETDELEAWVEEAQARGGDLLLHVERISFESEVKSRPHASNFLWFLLGPAVFEFPDRSYQMECTAGLAIYDLNVLAKHLEAENSSRASEEEPADAPPPLDVDVQHRARARAERLAKSGALLRQFRVQPGEIATKYRDRVDSYSPWTLFRPTANLSKGGDIVELVVAEESAVSMARTLAKQISLDADFLTRPTLPRLDSFFIELGPNGPDDVSRVRSGEEAGRVFEVTVTQRADFLQYGDLEPQVFLGDARSAASTTKSAVTAGGTVDSVGVTEASFQPMWSETLDDNAGATTWARKRLQIPLPDRSGAPGEPEYLQVVLTGPEGSSTRSWTFKLSDPAAGPVPSREETD